MPTLNVKICSYPGCGALASARYCEKHKRQMYTENNRQAHTNRDAGWYNLAQWKRVRLAQLRRHPLCEWCLERNRVVPATQVDHKVPRSQGGEDYDERNLRSLCASCHSKKTAKENGLGKMIKQDATR